MKLPKLKLYLSFLLTVSCSDGGGLNNSGNSTLIKTDIPVITSSSPASPALTNNPTLLGTTEPNATVQIYTDSACTQLAGTGSADSLGNFSIASVRIDGGSTTSYFAKAKSTSKAFSDCTSSSLNFRSTAIRPGLGFFKATQSTALVTPTKINQATAFALQWSSSDFDDQVYSHSQTTNTHEITVSQAGDYFLALTLPQTMTAGTYRACVRAEVRVNGTLVPGAVGQSSYIRFEPTTGNFESSAHIALLLEALSPNDIIEVFVQETAGQDGTENVVISDVASLYLEQVSISRDIFTASATRVVSGTNINTAAPSELEWSESKKGPSYTHADGLNPHQITLAAGQYMVYANIPLASTVMRASPKVLVQLNGVTVNGGQASQGYMRADSSHDNSSVHWSGLITATGGDILTLTSQQEAQTGTVTIQATGATLTVERITNTAGVLSLRGNDLTSGTDWNTAAASSILWDNTTLHDISIYSHNTSSNEQQITVNEPGDFLLVYNDSLTGASDRLSPTITVQVNGTDQPGASTKTHYMRNIDGHNESSASLVFLLRNLNAGDVVTVNTQRDVATPVVNDIEDAIITLIKK